MMAREGAERIRPERHLPKELLQRASHGNEYAWRLSDIPRVIEAARHADLVSVGGQLQFRLPEGTCECYWVEVNTYKSVPKGLPWNARVARTAEVALADFARLQSEYDFITEGRRAFGDHLRRVEERGESPAEAMWFVWYVLEQES
jgi:hypothetical protein